MPKRDSKKIFPQIVTVKSSAGSGKTYSLAKRYMGLLFLEILGLTPYKTHISNIVAITFTNKAASEMQKRIIDWMKRIILDKTIGSSSIDPIAEAIKEITDEIGFRYSRSYIKERIEKIFEDLIENYHDFKVCTIDSFVNLTLKASAFKLGLHPDFDISMESSTYIEAIIQQMLQRVVDDKGLKEKLERFLNDYLATEGETASWFPKNFIRETINTLWKEETKDNKYFLLQNSVLDLDFYLKEIRKRALNLLRSIISQESLKVEKRFIDILEECALSKGYDFIKSAYFKRPALSMMTTKKSILPDETLEGMWKEIRELLSNLVETISVSKYSPYLELYLEFKNILTREVMVRKRTVLIEQLNMLLQRVIKDENFIPEIYYALAERYNHFLVDEFQDTNHLQWKNIEVLAEEAISRGGTLFLVGDKKQAIYKWRGGKADLVDEIVKKYCQYDVQEYILDINFRSYEWIVRFNNTLYDPKNLDTLIVGVIGDVTDEERKKILASYACPAQKIYGPNMGKGYVYIEKVVSEEKENGDKKEHFSKKEGNELIKNRILETINRIMERGVYSLGDITILVRRREEAQYISRILLEFAIDVDSEFTVNVKNNPLVKEVISFLNFVDSPDDNIAFAGFILGEIFEKRTGIGKDRMAGWITDRRTQEKKGYLYKEFQGDFPSIWEELFDHLFKSAGYMPTYEFFMLFLKKWEVFQQFPHHAPFLLHLCELVKNSEALGKNSISSFLRFWDGDENYSNTGNNEQEKPFLLKRSEGLNAVKVMTIHKAKGLQSPVVILPFFKLTQFETSDGKDKTKFFVDEGEGKRLLYIKKDYTYHSEWLADIYRKRQVEFLLEEINNIYVATTRAEKELYLFLIDSKRQKNHLVDYLFEMDAFKPFIKGNTVEIGMPSTEGPTAQDYPVTILKNPSLFDLGSEIGWMGYIKSRSDMPVKPSAESFYAKIKGDAIHYILSLIKELPEKEEGDFIDLCIVKGLSKFNFFMKRAEIEETIKGMFRDGRIREFFIKRPGASVYTEKEVIDKKGRALKMDRLIVDEQKTKVIEFKTGELRAEEHVTQIHRYMEIIKAIYPGSLSEGYLVYLERNNIEVLSV